MKYLIIILFSLISLCGFSQTVTPFNRGSSSVLNRDARVQGYLNLGIPITSDTTLNNGLDSLGLLIFNKITRTVYFRDTTAGGHKWTAFSSGSSSALHFGIEDNLGIQNRNVDMEGFSLQAVNASLIDWVANNATRVAAIGAISDVTDANTYSFLHTEQDGSNYSDLIVNFNKFTYAATTNLDSLIVDDATQKLIWNKRFIRIDTLNYKFPTAHSFDAGSGTDGSVGNVRVLADTSNDGTLVWKLAPYFVNATFSKTYFGVGGTGGARTPLSGSSTTAFGYNVLSASLPSANNNTAVGVNTASSLTTGTSNDGFGVNNLFNLTTGIANTSYGTYTLNGVTTQSNNVAIGAGALSTDINNAVRNVTGIVASGTTAIGTNAGDGIPTANYTSTTTANNSIFVGRNNGVAAIGNSLDSTTVIGNFMKTALSNVFILGGATQKVIIPNNTLTVATDNGTKLQTPSFATGLVQKTANYTLTAFDHTVEATSGTFTFTLPTSVGISGREYFVANSGAGTITIGTTSSQTFVNVTGTPTSISLAGVGSALVQSNGTGWLVISGAGSGGGSTPSWNSTMAVSANLSSNYTSDFTSHSWTINNLVNEYWNGVSSGGSTASLAFESLTPNINLAITSGGSINAVLDLTSSGSILSYGNGIDGDESIGAVSDIGGFNKIYLSSTNQKIQADLDSVANPQNLLWIDNGGFIHKGVNSVGSVTSVAETFTGGLISVAGSPITSSGTFALTVAGTSGGIPYFSSASTWASSAALAANSLVIGGGAGVAPSTTTTGAGILTWLGTPSSANLAAAVTDETGTGALVFGTTPTLATPVINGLATGTGVASAATASTIVTRDANGNINANSVNHGYTTTATAAGTTTLTVASTILQYFTGSTTQTVTLPVTSTLVLGQRFIIYNLSTGAVTINSSGGNAVVILAANTSITVTCILTSGTTAASWDSKYLAGIYVSGTSMTFGSVSGTVPQFVEASITTSGTPTPTGDARENYLYITALGASTTFAAPSGTPANGNTVLIRVKDDATPRNLSWNAIYRASSDLPLPGITVTSKTIYVKFIYNSTDTKWDLVSVINNFSFEWTAILFALILGSIATRIERKVIKMKQYKKAA